MAKTLQEVLEENSISTFESSNGRRVAHCPFHEGDRRPSFTLYPNETYFCFGCKVWGNPIKFLVDYKSMSSEEAQAYVGVDYTLPRSEKRVIKMKNVLKTSAFLMGVAVDYHHHLMRTPGPKKYLMDRGLSERTIKQHWLGYSDGSVLQFEFGEEYAMAEEVGLLNKAGYDVLSHRIIIPNVIDGEFCDFMIGRTVINDKFKYLGIRTPKPIMGFHQYRHSPILFMVEGQFDWLLLKQWGYPAVVMSGSHIPRANRNLLRGKFIVYIPDNDEVGRTSAEAISETFGSNCAIIDLSKHTDYKDISEWAQNDSLVETKFGYIIQEELWNILSLNPIWEKYFPLSIGLPSSLST